MTLPELSALPLAAAVAVLIGHAALGAALALLGLLALRRAVDRGTGELRLGAAVGTMLARLAAVGAVLALTSLEGAGPLLATAFGLLATRTLVLRRIARTAP